MIRTAPPTESIAGTRVAAADAAGANGCAWAAWAAAKPPIPCPIVDLA
jgi:hypothetical protein